MHQPPPPAGSAPNEPTKPTKPTKPTGPTGPTGASPNTGNPTGSPANQPSPHATREHSVAQLLLRGQDLRFNSGPLFIVGALALCIAGLIGLARHRA